VLAALAVVSIVLLAILIVRIVLQPTSGTDPTTAIPAITSIFAVVVAIFAGYYAKKQWETAQKQDEIRNAREMYAAVLGAYNQAKTVRRNLRAILGIKSQVGAGGSDLL
jgi:glucan phosphoethanolaminetransferase (alkaline phosphatase superfamily)